MTQNIDNKTVVIKNLDHAEMIRMTRGHAGVIMIDKIIEIVDWINSHEEDTGPGGHLTNVS